MLLHHTLNNATIHRDLHLVAAKTCKVLHRLTLSIRSHNDFNVFGEVFGEPEGNIAFPVGLPVNKVVNSLKDQDNLFVDDVRIVNYLVLNRIVTDLEPV